MVLRHVCVAVDTTADLGLVGWAVTNVMREQDDLHLVKASLLQPLHAASGCSIERRILLAFFNRRFHRVYILQVCRSLIAISMSVTRRPARTKQRRSCTQLGRLHCSSGFAP